MQHEIVVGRGVAGMSAAHELIERGYKGSLYVDILPIGGNWPRDESYCSFTKHVFNIEDFDMVYIFSDGYQDQFGGPNDKKFTTAQFYSLLTNSHPRPLAEQKSFL